MGLFKDCGCGCNGKKQEQKFTISVISALTFFLVANPQTYILTRRLLGAGLSSVNGNPTLLGLIIHSIVFLLIVWAMMNIRQEKYEAPAPAKAEEAKGPSPAIVISTASKEEEEEEEEEAGPSPGPTPEKKEAEGLMFMDLEDGFASFDLEGSSMGAGPAPMTATQMTCGCPDGTTVQVARK
jgi:hypothetical protein